MLLPWWRNEAGVCGGYLCSPEGDPADLAGGAHRTAEMHRYLCIYIYVVGSELLAFVYLLRELLRNLLYEMYLW